MNLKNCSECGKVFIASSSNLCPACRLLELAEEDKVAEYLRSVSKSSLLEVCEATGVKEKIVLRMLKRGRIFGEVEVTYPCAHCGRPITEGQLCNICNARVIKELPIEKAPEPHKPESSGRSGLKWHTRVDK